MTLSPRTKKVLQVSGEAFRLALQWGFVPLVIYLGFTQGSDPLPNGELVPLTLSIVAVVAAYGPGNKLISIVVSTFVFTLLPMSLRVVESLKQILTTYHLTNTVLSLAFIISKTTPLLCQAMYSKCWFDTREHEVLVFLGVIIVWKNRKSANWLQYLSTFFLFSKFASGYLFYRANPLYGLVYGVAALAAYILFPEPEFAESDRITYFHGEGLQRELERDRSVVWVIEFFTSWSQESRRLAPVFSSLSEKYTLPNLRFGKLDVGRYPKEAEHFRINNHPLSKQLPSISIFKEGVQVERRPAVGSNSRAVPFVFTEENCIMAFGMNILYVECKGRLKRNKETVSNGKGSTKQHGD